MKSCEQPGACPFCGATRKVWRAIWTGTSKPHFMQCSNCGARGPVAASRDLAIAAWHRRRIRANRGREMPVLSTQG